mmetsp:Transcript_26019/g.73037  ORF Transcript_26019/g.73037 Transcript_26019/m.73037 type:complete len:239 (+) Transcript_26019:140-856(+)
MPRAQRIVARVLIAPPPPRGQRVRRTPPHASPLQPRGPRCPQAGGRAAMPVHEPPGHGVEPPLAGAHQPLRLPNVAEAGLELRQRQETQVAGVAPLRIGPHRGVAATSASRLRRVPAEGAAIELQGYELLAAQLSDFQARAVRALLEHQVGRRQQALGPRDRDGVDRHVRHRARAEPQRREAPEPRRALRQGRGAVPQAVVAPRARQHRARLRGPWFHARLRVLAAQGRQDVAVAVCG